MINNKMIIKNKVLNNNNLLCKNFIHITAINYSNNNSLNRILEESFRLEEVRISNLELVKYSTKVVKENSSESVNSPYNELFPWLIDDEGKFIDKNKPINTYDGVKLISRYLETKYNMNKNIISEVKINELLEIFEKEKDVTVYELYKHVSTLYEKNKDNFKSNIVENLSSVTDENVHSFMDVSTESPKPLGELGELKLNEIVTKLKDLKWDYILNKTEVSINVLPAAVNLVSYSFMIKNYIKHVHNRPFDQNISNVNKIAEITRRNRQLAYFSLLGAPLTLVFLNVVAVSYKDIITIKYNYGGSSGSINDNKVGLFLLLSNLNKKIPELVKIIIKILIFIILVLKFLGIGIIEFLTTWYYLKIYFFIGCSFVILLELTHLILLHMFAYKKINISEVLPDFFINKLKEIEDTSLNKVRLKEVKQSCYIQLSIYTVLLIMLLIIL